MRRFVAAFTLALGLAWTIGIQAQETKTKTETKVEGAVVNTVTYTGCIQTGGETKTFILDKVVPVARTTTRESVGTAGAVTQTTTTYALVPGEKVEFQEFVGRKVEVTGTMMSADEIKTTTKIEREGAPDSKITEKTKGPMPQFRVTSIKQTGEGC